MICQYCHEQEAVIVEGCPYQVCDQCWAYLGIAYVRKPAKLQRFVDALRAVWLFVRIVWREDQSGGRMSFRTAVAVCVGVWQ